MAVNILKRQGPSTQAMLVVKTAASMMGTTTMERELLVDAGKLANGKGRAGRQLIMSQTGMAVRYAIVAFLFAFILLFFVGGYYHAQRRIRRGQEPLAYHRWMIKSRHYNYSFQPRPGQPQDASYGMDNYPPPPPAYSSAEPPPPVYQPPQGATKAMADQNYPQPQRHGEGSGTAGIPAPGFPAPR